jgi:apolipoprotein N-acyltransferase
MKISLGKWTGHGRLLLAFLAGALLASSFPTLGLAGMAWIAPGFLAALAVGRSSGGRFRIGYVGGLAHYTVSLYWLLHIPYRWHSIPLAPALGWLALSAYMALFTGAWAWFTCSSSHAPGAVGWRNTNPDAPLPGSWSQRAVWAFSGAAAWVAMEMIAARLFTGFPWNLLGASQWQMTPLIQLTSVTGIYGVSFLLVWFSLSLVSAGWMILQRPSQRSTWMAEIILPFVAVAVAYAAGFSRLAHSTEPDRKIRLTLVQPSIPQTLIWDETRGDERFMQLAHLSELALTNPTDVLLWPEAAVPKLLRYDSNTFSTVTSLARTHQVWLILGADDAEVVNRGQANEKAVYFNSSFLVNRQGRLAEHYRKRNLVIFGEYIPMSKWLPFLQLLAPVGEGFQRGKGPVPFSLPDLGIKTSVLICFEDLFPHYVREYVDDDTDFLVNLTNNGWFGESAAQWQHAVSALFRAVENGVPLVRCANNGLTCWVDSCGRLQQVFSDSTGSVYGPGVMRIQLPVPNSGSGWPATWYRLHGDVFGWICVAWTAVQAALIFKSLHRRKNSTAP